MPDATNCVQNVHVDADKLEAYLKSLPKEEMTMIVSDQKPEPLVLPQTGVKFDQGKFRISLLPGLAITEVMKVGEFGARKYDAHNYRKGMPVTKFIDAAYRHIFREWLFGGVEYDICPEKSNPQLCPQDDLGRCKNHSGLHHLAHGAWNILAALEQMMTKPKLDDRWKYSKED